MVGESVPQERRGVRATVFGASPGARGATGVPHVVLPQTGAPGASAGGLLSTRRPVACLPSSGSSEASRLGWSLAARCSTTFATMRARSRSRMETSCVCSYRPGTAAGLAWPGAAEAMRTAGCGLDVWGHPFSFRASARLVTPPVNGVAASADKCNVVQEDNRNAMSGTKCGTRTRLSHLSKQKINGGSQPTLATQ